MSAKRAIVMIVIGLVVGWFTTGCTPDNGPKAVSQSRANQLNAGQSESISSETISDRPLNANTRYAAGQLAESSGASKDAIEQYNEALKLDPKHAPSLYRLGVVYSKQKKYSEAIESWQKYIEVTNGVAAGWGNLGFCYELAGRNDEAESAYRKGIAKDPTNSACRVNYGLMLARHGRTGEATTQLSAALSPAEVHYNLGSVYESQHRREQAKAEYRKAIELDESLADAKARLASLE